MPAGHRLPAAFLHPVRPTNITRDVRECAMRNRLLLKEKRLMRRACCFALLTAILIGEAGLGQTKKVPKDFKPAAREELAPPPVATAGAPAGTAHPSPYKMAVNNAKQ